MIRDILMVRTGASQYMHASNAARDDVCACCCSMVLQHGSLIMTLCLPPCPLDHHQYMDRTYVAQQHKTPVFQLGLDLWRDTVCLCVCVDVGWLCVGGGALHVYVQRMEELHSPFSPPPSPLRSCALLALNPSSSSSSSIFLPPPSPAPLTLCLTHSWPGRVMAGGAAPVDQAAAAGHLGRHGVA